MQTTLNAKTIRKYGLHLVLKKEGHKQSFVRSRQHLLRHITLVKMIAPENIYRPIWQRRKKGHDLQVTQFSSFGCKKIVICGDGSRLCHVLRLECMS